MRYLQAKMIILWRRLYTVKVSHVTFTLVTTVTVPTPIQPTLTCLRHSRAIRTIPEPLCQSRTPSSLTRSSRLINASRSLWPHPEPVRILATHPEPSGFIPSQLASHQHTPEPSDPLASRQPIPDTIPIPDPTPLLSLFLSLASSPFPTIHRSRDCGRAK